MHAIDLQLEDGSLVYTAHCHLCRIRLRKQVPLPPTAHTDWRTTPFVTETFASEYRDTKRDYAVTRTTSTRRLGLANCCNVSMVVIDMYLSATALRVIQTCPMCRASRGNVIHLGVDNGRVFHSPSVGATAITHNNP